MTGEGVIKGNEGRGGVMKGWTHAHVLNLTQRIFAPWRLCARFLVKQRHYE